MDFMKTKDVSLLCGPEKVLFGTELLTFMGIDMTDMADIYGDIQSVLNRLSHEAVRVQTEVPSNNNCKESDDPDVTPNSCFRMAADDDGDVFDADMCVCPERFEQLAAIVRYNFSESTRVR